MLKHAPWIRIGRDILVEYEQCILEGREVEKYHDACKALAALDGDEIMGKLFHKQAHYIGIAAANSINLFNPSVLIFNGYISQLGDDIKTIITQQIFRNCLKSAKANVRIVYSSLNQEALQKGAAALVISKLFEYPSQFFGDKYDL